MDARLERSQQIDVSFEFQPFIARNVDQRILQRGGRLLILSTSRDADQIIERHDYLFLYLTAVPCDERDPEPHDTVAAWAASRWHTYEAPPPAAWNAPTDLVASQILHEVEPDRFYYAAAIPEHEWDRLRADGNGCAYLGASAMWFGGFTSNIFLLTGD